MANGCCGMHTPRISGLVTAVIVLAVMVLAVMLVAVLKCPPQEIPAVIRAFGSWLHVGILIKA